MTLDLLQQENTAASARYRRTWVEEVARLIRAKASDDQIESYVRSIPFSNDA